MIPDNSVDVIIPGRGSTPWLEPSLTSIALQSFQPGAIIVIDDGLAYVSSTEDLGKKLFGRRFRLIRNAGQGISAALNTGIQQSDAHWIARMDADDISHPNRFQRQLEFLSANSPGFIGCGSQVRFINAHGKVLGHSHLPTAWHKFANTSLKEHVLSILLYNEERRSSCNPLPSKYGWSRRRGPYSPSY